MNTDSIKNLWGDKLISKYDSRGPRYTSYPTALQFTHDFNAEDYQKNLAAIKDTENHQISLYIHIPFCENICYYCACNKIVTNNKSVAKTYLSYLKKEMALLANTFTKRQTVVQLHFGGGTPTFLSNQEIIQLIDDISGYFNLSKDSNREFSIEIDPRTIDIETLSLLKNLGFNRLSFGVQDFSEDVQAAINRKNSFELVSDLMKNARKLAFNSINLDFIYGLPKQNSLNLNNTLNQILSLKPDRIAFYNYAHLPERFLSQRAIDRHTLPSATEKLTMLKLIHQCLTGNGFIDIGMDHFVQKDDAMAIAQQKGKLTRNFQGYATHKSPSLIGLGVSAISSGSHFFAQNTKNIEHYYQKIDAEQLPIEKGYQCSEDDLKRRTVIIELISNFQFDITQWEQQYQVDFFEYFRDEIKQLEKAAKEDQLLTISESTIQVMPKGKPFIRSLCAIFDNYLKNDTTSYSKVI